MIVCLEQDKICQQSLLNKQQLFNYLLEAIYSMLTLFFKGNCGQEHMKERQFLKPEQIMLWQLSINKQIYVLKCGKQTLKNKQLKKWQHLSMIYLGVNMPVLCQA